MTEEDTNIESHNKPCTLCGKPQPVLVRCQIDETNRWHFVCPGKCWRSVSGGEIDAKGHKDEYPYYRYGGMWKNRHADGPLNAKKPKKKKKKNKKWKKVPGEGDDAGSDRAHVSGQSEDESDDLEDRRLAEADRAIDKDGDGSDGRNHVIA